MEKHTISGKTVMITGASRGIGEAAAHAFVEAGANVVLLARSQSQIGAIADALGDAAMAVTCDVADFASMQAAVDQSIGQFGGVDVLIGNAGMIEPIGHMASVDPADYGRAIDVNLKGVFNGMRAVLPHMIGRGNGTIITTSSGAAHNAVEGWAAYCSGKAGAYMLTRAADNENRGQGIRVLGLSPGTVATQMQREIKKSGINAVSMLDWSDHIPPEWAARALVWMCGPDADSYLGDDVHLRDDDVRKKIGLI